MYKLNADNIISFLDDHSVAHSPVEDANGGLKKIVLDHCAFDESHAHKDAAIIIKPNGALKYKCLHNSCANKTFFDFVKQIDPTFYQDSAIQEQGRSHEKKYSGPLQWTTFDQVSEKTVSWLVPGYLPRKGVTILGGDGGVGKSSIEVALASAISNGQRTFLEAQVPFDGERKPGKVVLLNAEDPFGEVLKPLLTAYGANEANILTLDEKQIKEAGLTYDHEGMKKDIVSFKPDLIIFDPLQAFLPDRVKMAERNAMRRQLNHAVALAVECDCAVLIVMHSNKSKQVSGRQRLADSADVWDIARSVLMAGINEDEHSDLRHITHEKSNFSKLQDSIVFYFDERRLIQVVERNQLRDRDYVCGSILRSDEPKNKSTPADEAIPFIRDLLRASGRMEVRELDASIKQMGFSAYAVRKAREAMKVTGEIITTAVSHGKGKGATWYAELSEFWEEVTGTT